MKWTQFKRIQKSQAAPRSFSLIFLTSSSSFSSSWASLRTRFRFKMIQDKYQQVMLLHIVDVVSVCSGVLYGFHKTTTFWDRLPWACKDCSQHWAHRTCEPLWTCLSLDVFRTCAKMLLFLLEATWGQSDSDALKSVCKNLCVQFVCTRFSVSSVFCVEKTTVLCKGFSVEKVLCVKTPMCLYHPLSMCTKASL